MLKKIFCLLMLAWPCISNAQNQRPKEKEPARVDLSFDGYPVRLANNVIEVKSGKELDYWIQHCRQVLATDTGKINIVHIGDSHLQADGFSGRMRELMQLTFGNGGRGLVFPYRLARTNTPDSYRLAVGGVWEQCKNVSYKKTCDLGITGIAVSTQDTSAYFTLNPNTYDSGMYNFSHAFMFSRNTANSFRYYFREDSAHNVPFQRTDIDSSVAEIKFERPLSFASVALQRTDTNQHEFYFMGMSLLNDKKGVVYNMAGINGAMYYSWVRCNWLVPQLKQLQPHLVIISLGTNEGFSPVFAADTFKWTVRTLIEQVRLANPDASILLTLPGESLMRRRHAIPRLIIIRQLIREVALEQNCAVWDMYQVMGGKGSVKRWRSRKLAKKDMVHYVPQGYRLQGELLYSALMDFYAYRSKRK